jgi:hypothetical protein
MSVGVTCLHAATPAFAQEVEAQAATGIEADSNPRRNVGPTQGGDVASRTFLSLDVAWREPRREQFSVLASGAAGARVLADSNADDSIVSDLGARAVWTSASSHSLYLSGSMRDRTEREHFRDYRRLAAAVGVIARTRATDLRLDASLSSLVYKPNPLLNWSGPAIGFYPAVYVSERLILRFNAIAQVRSLSDAEDSTNEQTGIRDLTLGVGGELEWSGQSILGVVGYGLQRNVSSASGRSYTRHAPFAEATAMAGERILIRGRAVAQFSRFDDATFIDDTFLIDDDNRTQMTLAAEWTVGHAGFFLESRTTAYLDAFRGDELSYFRRFLLYGGVGWRWRAAGSRPD